MSYYHFFLVERRVGIRRTSPIGRSSHSPSSISLRTSDSTSVLTGIGDWVMCAMFVTIFRSFNIRRAV